MSVTLRPYRGGGWEVDITIRLPDGSQYRERKRVPLLEIGGAPMGRGSGAVPVAARPADGEEGGAHARSIRAEIRRRPRTGEPSQAERHQRNRIHPQMASRSGARPEASRRDHQRTGAAAETDADNSRPEDRQQRVDRVEHVVEEGSGVGELERLPCAIKLLPNPKKTMGFHDFDQYERLLTVARRRGAEAYLMVVLGGDAGLRLGEILALEWRDVELTARRLTVQRSDWLGHVTVPKGGRSRELRALRYGGYPSSDMRAKGGAGYGDRTRLTGLGSQDITTMLSPLANQDRNILKQRRVRLPPSREASAFAKLRRTSEPA